MTILSAIITPSNILTAGNVVTLTNKTIDTASNTLAVAGEDITTGTVGTARLATGTADATTYLRGDSTWAAAGLTYFTESESTAGVNATVPVDALTVANAGTNVDVALVSKGTGAILAQIPDGTATRGNKRGTYAVDWQVHRISSQNVASGSHAVISGGYNNRASSQQATVIGGYANIASGAYAVAGGFTCTATDSAATVSGGYFNNATGGYATIGGGRSNTAGPTNSYITVGGGYLNNASGSYATIGGGNTSTASGGYTTVSGGSSHSASQSYATIGGGFSNSASGSYATIGGGRSNTATASYTTASGYLAQATATASVALGYAVQANGGYSTALGYYSTARLRNNVLVMGSNVIVGGGLGNCQTSIMQVGAATTDATPTVLTTATSTSYIYQNLMDINSAYAFKIMLVAGVTGAGDTKAWELTGCVKRGASGVPTLVGTVTKTVIAEDAGASTWDCDIVTDTDAFTVQATGQAATTIRWSASIYSSEFDY